MFAADPGLGIWAKDRDKSAVALLPGWRRGTIEPRIWRRPPPPPPAPPLPLRSRGFQTKILKRDFKEPSGADALRRRAEQALREDPACQRTAVATEILRRQAHRRQIYARIALQEIISHGSEASRFELPTWV